jgi:hypothetical protein
VAKNKFSALNLLAKKVFNIDLEIDQNLLFENFLFLKLAVVLESASLVIQTFFVKLNFASERKLVLHFTENTQKLIVILMSLAKLINHLLKLLLIRHFFLIDTTFENSNEVVDDLKSLEVSEPIFINELLPIFFGNLLLELVVTAASFYQLWIRNCTHRLMVLN